MIDSKGSLFLLILSSVVVVIFASDCNDRDYLIDAHGIPLEDTILVTAFNDAQRGDFGKPWNDEQKELFFSYKKRIKEIIRKDSGTNDKAAHRRIARQIRMFLDDISNTMIQGSQASRKISDIPLGSWGTVWDYIQCDPDRRKIRVQA